MAENGHNKTPGTQKWNLIVSKQVQVLITDRSYLYMSNFHFDSALRVHKIMLSRQNSILGEKMQFSRSKFPKIPQSWLNVRLLCAHSILVCWEKVGRSWGTALFLVFFTPWTWPKWGFRPFLGTMGWLNCLWRVESNFVCQNLLDTPHPAYKQAIRHSNSTKLKNS